MAEHDQEPSASSLAHVSARAIGAIVQAFRRLGLDSGKLLEEAGLEPDDLADPDERLSYERLLRLWVGALRESGDASLGLHASQTIQFDDYEIVGYLAQTCGTVAELLVSLRRYERLLADAVEIQTTLEGEEICIRYDAPQGHQLPRAVAEYVIGVLVLLMREVIGDDLDIREIRFHHETPVDAEECSRVLRAPVRFGSEDNAVLFWAPLEQRLPGADSTLNTILRRQADRLVAENTGDPFVREVSEVVALTLRSPETAVEDDGASVPDAAEVAARMEISSRTLKRRLSDRGTSLREIVDSLRREFAIHYLATTRLSVGEIGFLVGFSEPRAFHRAFRRWTNKTPGAFRDQNQL